MYYPTRLRTHALLVSTSLLTLTALLGIRAYSVARSHKEETQSLLKHDMRAQSLVIRTESLLAAQKKARRKFQITHDPKYATLNAHYKQVFRETNSLLNQELSQIYPELLHRPLIITNNDDIQLIRARLESSREGKLEQAHNAARGLLHVIALALVISLGLTAWLIYLFYHGLIDPLRSLQLATARIENGDLSCRIPLKTRGISELKTLTSSFNKMAEKLEVLDKAKTEFYALISHEIKNPLAALKEGLNLLSSQDISLSPLSRKRAFFACSVASKRLETMINNMLRLSKAQKGLFEFELAPKAINTAIETAIAEVRPLADKKCMQFSVVADRELEALYNWDGMIQVFENLFLNAIKYGTENSTIDIKAHASSSSFIEIMVSNHGKPLAISDLDHAFDKFYRGSNIQQQQGLGIGLHVVKKIIEAHRGTIGISSDPDGKTHLLLKILAPSKLLEGAMAIVMTFSLSSCAALNKYSFYNTPTELKQLDSLSSLDHELAAVQSERVIIPTHTLRSLLAQDQQKRNRCKSINKQLEALKRIDLDERTKLNDPTD
jgi:signal transduction histidine kinase